MSLRAIYAAALVQPNLPGADLLASFNVSDVVRSAQGVYVLTLIDGLGPDECLAAITERSTGGVSVGVMPAYELAPDGVTLTVTLKNAAGGLVDAIFSLVVDRVVD